MTRLSVSEPGFNLAELSDLVLLHARAQGVSRSLCRHVLNRIDHVEGDGPGSWCAEWARAGDRMAGTRRHLDACRLYNMARFPYPDEPAQARAGELCVASFDRWRTNRGGIARLDMTLRGNRVPVWAAGLDPGVPRPLLLLIGGIVSPKEQWAPNLPLARRLGMAAVAAEMPGVGENPLVYGRESWQMLPDLFDGIAELVPVPEVYVIAMSFGGHLALRCAAHDRRIRGVVTVGSPVAAFFENAQWWSQVPETTKRTLAHLTRLPLPEVREGLRGLALRPDELAQISAPVHYVISKRDEIVPAEEPRLLAENTHGFASIEFDDVHGSPNHTTDTKLWILRSLIKLSEGSRFRLAALDALLRLRGVTEGIRWKY